MRDDGTREDRNMRVSEDKRRESACFLLAAGAGGMRQIQVSKIDQ
jgi:hypothetical protein